MPGNDDRARSGRTGEMLLSMQEIIQLSVESAVSKVLDESGKQSARTDCRGELERMSEAIRTGFRLVNDRLDDVKEELATGSTKFAVMDVEHRHLRAAVDGLERQAKGRDTGGHRTQQSPKASPDDDRPLVSPKIWNAMILAAVTAIAGAGGGLVWDRIRGSDKQPAPAVVQQTPSTKSPPQQQQGP